MSSQPMQSDWRSKAFTICLAVVGLALIGCITYNTIHLVSGVKELDQTRVDFLNYNKVRTRIREGSDLLTESARRYVTTGDAKFRDDYFREANETKNREWGILLAERLSENYEEGKKIEDDFRKALQYSLELMEVEYHAMRLIATDEEAAAPDYPKELKDTPIPENELTLTQDGRRRRAIGMLLDGTYDQYKHNLYNLLDDAVGAASRLTDLRRNAATARNRVLWISQTAFVGVFILFFFIFLVLEQRISARRLAMMRDLLDKIPLFISLKDLKTRRYVDYNKAYADNMQAHGINDSKGKTDYEILDDKTAQTIEISDKAALGKSEPIIGYESIPNGIHGLQHFRTMKLEVPGYNGHPCLLSMVMDITDDYAQHLNTKALNGVLKELQTGPSLSAPTKVLEIIRNRLDADFCYLARYDEEGGQITVETDAFVSRTGWTLPKRLSATTHVTADLIDHLRFLGIYSFNEDESAQIRKFFKIERIAPEAPHAVEHIALRLTVQGEFRGILAVAYVSQRILSDLEKEFLQEIANVLENAVERKVVYSALSDAKNEAISEGNLSSSILNLMPIPCVVKDPSDDFRYVRCNKAFAQLHHKEPEELIGKRGEDFFSAESLAIINRTDREAIETGELVTFEDTCLWGDCNRRIFLYWKSSMVMKDGRTLLFCVAQDITEVKQKINSEHFRNEITAFLLGHSEPEELLDFVAKRLIDTLGCQHVLLHRHDGTRQDWFPDDEHTYCNKCTDCPLKTAEPVLFCHNGNVVLNDDNMADFPLPENCPTRTLIARQIIFEGEEWGKLGTLFTGDAHASLGFCEELLEQVANVISVCIERKERNMVIKRQNEEVVRINRQLQLAKERAVSEENAKSYFFSCISHDIRTPLNSIMGYTELLKKGLPDEKERTGAYDAIAMSGRTLLQFVTDMIDLAKLETDGLVIEPVLADMNDLAAKALQSFEIAVAGKEVKLVGNWDDNMPYVVIDPKRTWQILFNLLDNAVKFTEEGEITLKMAFEPEGPGGTLRITVADTGTGMDRQTRENVLKTHAMISKEGMHGFGSGLGLTITRHLIERMHGTLTLRSELGQGTAFEIAIPVEKASDRKTTFPRPGSLIDFRGKSRGELRVLIVDDVPLNISVLRTMLRKNGVTDIVTSTNGKDALEKIRADVKKFDLVLTDLWMPEMDGRKMLQALRADPQFRSLNVIAITADVDARDECMTLGFSDVIFKPVTINKIVNFLPPGK